MFKIIEYIKKKLFNKPINLSKALALQIAAGCPMCSEEELEKRNSICKKCNSYNHKQNTCKECGCFLYLKARLKTSKCPLGLWEEDK